LDFFLLAPLLTDEQIESFENASNNENNIEMKDFDGLLTPVNEEIEKNNIEINDIIPIQTSILI
jgi:hypothetical protein